MGTLAKFWEIGEDYYNEQYIPLKTYTREECKNLATKELNNIYEVLVNFSRGKNLVVHKGEDYVRKETERIELFIQDKNNPMYNRCMSNPYIFKIYYGINWAPKQNVAQELSYTYEIYIENFQSYTCLNNKNNAPKQRKFTEQRLYEILKHFQPLWEIK